MLASVGARRNTLANGPLDAGGSHEHQPAGSILAHRSPRARRLGGRLRLAGRLQPPEGHLQRQDRPGTQPFTRRRRRRHQDDHRRAERTRHPRWSFLWRSRDHPASSKTFESWTFVALSTTASRMPPRSETTQGASSPPFPYPSDSLRFVGPPFSRNAR